MRSSILSILIAATLVLPGRAQAQVSDPQLPLTAAIDRALTRGSRTTATRASAEAATAAAGRLTSAYMPRLSAAASVIASEHPLTITPIREPGVFPELGRTIYDVSVDAAWTVFDFGHGSAARQSAQAAARAAGARYDLTRLETIEAVASKYVRIGQLRARMEAEERRVDALRRQEEQLGLLFEEGRVARADVLRASEAVISAETDLMATSNELETVLARLTAETASPAPVRDADIPPIDLHVASPPREDLPTSASPHVVAAEAQLDAARDALRASRRALLPTTEVFATERLRSGSELDFDTDLSGGVRIRIPLFNGPARARRQIRQAEVAERRAELDLARQEVQVAAGDLQRRIVEAHRRAEAAARRQEHLEETFRIDRAAYEEGRLTLTDLLATESRLAATRVEEIGARAAVLLYHLQMDVLKGTLTPRRAAQLIGE